MVIGRISLFNRDDTETPENPNPARFSGVMKDNSGEEYSILLWRNKSLAGTEYYTGIVKTKEDSE